MTPLAGVYLFLLGLASGVSLLTITAYRRVSPPWLRWLLIASGMLVAGRYVTMALFTSPSAPQQFWGLRHLWLGTSIGLTLPSVFAIDQLLRHPALSPKRLLQWFAPFLVAYGAVILFGRATPEPDRVAGWIPRLSPGWQRWLSIVHGIFSVSLIGMCLALARRVPSRLRIALLGLALGCALLAIDGVLVAAGRWYFRPYLYSELVMLLALWHAYEISATQ